MLSSKLFLVQKQLVRVNQSTLRCFSNVPYSPFTDISPENRQIARNRIYGKFRTHFDEFDETSEKYLEELDLEEDVEDTVFLPGQASIPDVAWFKHIKNEIKVNDAMTEIDETHQEPEFEKKLKKMGIIHQLIAADRVQKVTAQGKTLNFRSLVIAGNQKGVAGYGVGKADNVKVATERALKKAVKNAIYLELYEGRTLYHEVHGKFNSSTLFIRPTGKGRGNRTSDIVGAALYCFGIDDVSAKLHGQRNPFTVVKAIFNALQQHKSADVIAMSTGRSIQELLYVARNK